MCDAFPCRIRALTDGVITAMVWGWGNKDDSSLPVSGAPPPEPGARFRPPPKASGKGRVNENTNCRCRPLPAHRRPHHQPPTPAWAPSPTNRAAALASPRQPQPHKNHLPNSLPPPHPACITYSKTFGTKVRQYSTVGAKGMVKGG